MDLEILLWIIRIYLVGFVISVFIFKREIGEDTEDLIGNRYKKSSTDVCLKSMCWPLLFLVLIVILPFMLITKLICKK